MRSMPVACASVPQKGCESRTGSDRVGGGVSLLRMKEASAEVVKVPNRAHKKRLWAECHQESQRGSARRPQYDPGRQAGVIERSRKFDAMGEASSEDLR